MKSWPGYIFAFLLESVGAFATCVAAVNFLCIFIGSSWILTSMAKEITSDLHEMNVSKSSNKDQCEVQWRFCYISKRFSKTQQLSQSL